MRNRFEALFKHFSSTGQDRLRALHLALLLEGEL
jgi:hypothetical protein